MNEWFLFVGEEMYLSKLIVYTYLSILTRNLQWAATSS